jgi:hypothetical protein
MHINIPMKFKNLLFYFVAFSLLISLNAKAQRTCSTMDQLQLSSELNPEIHKNRERIERETSQWIDQSKGKASRSIITIPVVVHVVYRTEGENISEAQIRSQIDVLNEDYARLNADASNTPSDFQGVATDCEIRFCLASRDPSGLPTNGITRTQTTATAFSLGGGVKSEATGGKSAWPTGEYLNIWVCNLTSPVIGFATLPGTAAAGQDGVVIIYKHFGRVGAIQAPYNKGRTATHEVGHWLNLLHIWGDDENSSDNCAGSDQVSDTPNQGGPNYSCPSAGTSSCGSADMFMNYMDYVDDNCMNLFTQGQKSRMLATLNGFRASLQNSQACQAPPVANDCDTLNNIVGGDGLVYYLASEFDVTASGYLVGTNSFGDQAFAEQYTSLGEHAVYGFRMDFSYARAGSNGATTRFIVWDSDGTNPPGSPGTILAQTNFPLETIAQNAVSFTFTDIELPLPVNVNGTYYIGFEVSTSSGDSISLYTNQFDDVNVNSAWLKNSGEWLSFDSPLAYDGALSLAAKPFQCSTVGIKSIDKQDLRINLYPNPSKSGVFSMEIPGNAKSVQYEAFSIDGKLIAIGDLPGSGNHVIRISDKPGIYFLRTTLDKKTVQISRVVITKP